LAKTIEVTGGSVKIFTNVIASPVRAKQSIFGRLVFALVFACIFIACGDESGSSAPAPDPADGSSSSVAPTSNDEDLSSSSQKSSGKEKSSSSVKPGDDSQKSSSSSGKTNGSSSSEEGVVSSSSSNSETICNDGDLDTLRSGLYIIYRKCENGTWVKDHYDVLAPSSSSDAHYDMTEQFYCNGYPDCEYASEDYTDPRDKQVYKTLTYVFLDSSHVYRVFAENLNYGKQIMKGSLNFDDDAVEKYCYNDDEWYCDNVFGGLYTWSEAMGLPKACDSLFVDSSSACKDSFVPPEGHSEKFGFYVQRQGICPEGWHVMNGREWLRLNDVSHRGLSSPIVWHGWNSRGFSALPVGYLRNGEYVDFGGWAFFHEPEEFEAKRAKIHYISKQSHREANDYKNIAASIRCVEDYEDTLWE
jgi:uncharacterized protein (TIGR02145 family)